MSIIRHYFITLPEKTLQKLNAYAELVRQWNMHINLVSRKDIDSFEEHHLLPVLAITKWDYWNEFNSVLDVGSGAGLPGIPLAILYPGTRFTLIDSIGKKIKVLEQIISALGLSNVEAHQQRVETLDKTYDAVVGRAVMNFEKFSNLVSKNLNRKEENGGVFYWSGENGNGKYVKSFELPSIFSEKYFEGKKILHRPTKTFKG